MTTINERIKAQLGYPRVQVNPPQYPDWEHGLNAMHELEAGMTDEQKLQYPIELSRVLGTIPRTTFMVSEFALLHATAAQRAEAWLAVMGG
jgi:hypothetical protein